MTEKTAPEALPPEQAAELAALEAAAAEGDPAAAQAAQEPPPPAIDLAAELAGLLQTVAAVLTPALPSLGAIYTPEACERAGAAIAAVCNKHGWLQGGIVGGYGEELAALAIVGPMAVATYHGVRADMERHKRAERRPAPAAPEPPAPAAPEATAAPVGSMAIALAE